MSSSKPYDQRSNSSFKMNGDFNGSTSQQNGNSRPNPFAQKPNTGWSSQDIRNQPQRSNKQYNQNDRGQQGRPTDMNFDRETRQFSGGQSQRSEGNNFDARPKFSPNNFENQAPYRSHRQNNQTHWNQQAGFNDNRPSFSRGNQQNYNNSKPPSQHDNQSQFSLNQTRGVQRGHGEQEGQNFQRHQNNEGGHNQQKQWKQEPRGNQQGNQKNYQKSLTSQANQQQQQPSRNSQHGMSQNYQGGKNQQPNRNQNNAGRFQKENKSQHFNKNNNNQQSGDPQKKDLPSNFKADHQVARSDNESMIPNEPEIISGECYRCGRLSYMECQICSTFYCSNECQKQDWSQHWEQCGPPSLILARKNKRPRQTNAKIPKSIENTDTPNDIKSLVKVPSVQKSTQRGDVPIIRKLDNGDKVLITHVDQANRVYLRSLAYTHDSDYCEIVQQINEYAATSDCLQKRPKYGDIVLAKNHDIYVRAYVGNYTSESSVKVMLIDSGEALEMDVNELRYLRHELQVKMRYAFQVLLHDVPGIPSQSAIEYMNKLKRFQTQFYIYYEDNSDSQTVTLVLVSSGEKLNDTLNQKITNESAMYDDIEKTYRNMHLDDEVPKYQQPSKKDNENILLKKQSPVQKNFVNNNIVLPIKQIVKNESLPQNQNMVKKPSTLKNIDSTNEVLLPIEQKKENESLPQKENMVSDINMQPIETQTLLRIYVTDLSMLDDNKITFIPLSELDELSQQLEKITAHCIDCPSINYSPIKNELCLAKYEDEWYRASCLNVLDDDVFQLHFLDYGNIEKIEKSNIRKMVKTFMKPCKTVTGILTARGDELVETKKLLHTENICSVNVEGLCNGLLTAYNIKVVLNSQV